MRVYDQIAAVVKSGGKTRRAAKMQSLKVWHPDIMEFIECKHREEKKARLLIQEGYDPQEAYDSILFQNANLSVRVTDEFMEAVVADKPWTTHWVTDPARQGPTYPAREMFGQHGPGGLGVRRPGRAVRHHDQPLAHLPELRAGSTPRNPCSEYMFLDDSACNLASINLMKFRLRGRRRSTWRVSRRPAGWCSSPRRSWSITPAIRRRGSRPTATASGRSGWATRTSAA